jgi:hypothetical protein
MEVLTAAADTEARMPADTTSAIKKKPFVPSFDHFSNVASVYKWG